MASNTPSQTKEAALLQACDSDDIERLKQLMETLHAEPKDLQYGIWPAIEHDRSKMVRFLLEMKVDEVDGFMLEMALKASAINVLEVFKEFGWTDVNDGVNRVNSSRGSVQPITALL